MFADIAFPQRRYQVFTYRVPISLSRHLQVGSRVLVPLGRSSIQGLVYQLFQDFPSKTTPKEFSQKKIREISALVDAPQDASLDPTLIELASQVGDFYLAPPGAALRLILPPALPNRIAKRIALTDAGRLALQSARLSEAQSTVLARLAKTTKGLTLATLLKTIDGNTSVLSSLKRRKFIQDIEWVRVADKKETLLQRNEPSILDSESESRNTNYPQDVRSPTSPVPASAYARVSSWWSRVHDAIHKQEFSQSFLNASQSIREHLLMRSIQEALRQQRRVMVLYPEIQQVSQVFMMCQQKWGNRAGIFHGDLSVQVRARTWRDIQAGHCDVVVGTRAALFLPLPQLGLIWVDQEESSSYQEEQSPYYHACEVARMRARLESAVLIYGSSHPSLASVYAFRLLEDGSISQNLSSRALPSIEVVNLREVPFDTILSSQILKGMQRALSGKGQALLFVNRKGFSRAITCRDCGYVPQCQSCGVTLVVYQHPRRMKCSLCGAVHVLPEICLMCQSARLETSGYGTEQVEACVKEKFPESAVLRFDRESLKTLDEENAALEAIQDGSIDIVIATELIFGRKLSRSMKFVGIPNADTGLHFPDFRSAERTYHRLMQAVQFVDEDANESEIVLQTLLPEHHVIRAVAQREPIVFYQEEWAIRQALQYPPCSHIIHIAISGKASDRVQEMALHCRKRLLAMGQDKGIRHPTNSTKIAKEFNSDRLLGPLHSSRLKGYDRTRYILIVKTTDDARDRELIKRMQVELRVDLKRERLEMEIKVDPADLN